jgi:hypothetical protein
MPLSCSLVYKVLKRFVALAGFVTFILVRDFVVGSKTILREVTPEGAIVTMWDFGVPHGIDEHPFPAQIIATVVVGSG